MSESAPSLHLHTAYNPYPKCVFLQVTPRPSATSQGQFTLELNFRFNEQEKSLLNGQIRFGIKGGKLNLIVQQGKLIEPQFNSDVPFKLIDSSDQSTIWHLIAQTGQSTLKIDNSCSLATIEPTDESVKVNISYTINLADISITDITGLWRHDIHPNKHSILERKLAQFLWKQRLSPEISMIQLTSKALEVKKIDSPTTNVEPQHLADLHQLINNIYDIKTNNLLELIKIAGLNSKIDLAGGNFLGTELSGIELSGANLTHSNFRGANLTDADLSEAILSYTRFSGADLSGAYLGNANLQQADFYRSSLALANLIGADLRGANLQEVNLTQTNLSGALVQGSKFGNNEGMTPEIQTNLLERGAIFPEE
ncbi:rfrA family pentapeptide repeat [Crocosphaera subtropica ATCC 51142]|uniref:RfrA family pentapeptide repeat n=1 Tax=Crocosphaera subtropica (strain ATCC 51142 / BH68) TaxID=43989 RepID=B1WW56_CROS5|nr:pentapeptide repeat-containing protein [Crocosphaera subtropica]ACB53984.1 rfrA family pentapeptide repeat [Crocosphaera subtropica ATCC 51142]